MSDESVTITNRFRRLLADLDGVEVEALVEDDEAATDAAPGQARGTGGPDRLHAPTVTPCLYVRPGPTRPDDGWLPGRPPM